MNFDDGSIALSIGILYLIRVTGTDMIRSVNNKKNKTNKIERFHFIRFIVRVLSR